MREREREREREKERERERLSAPSLKFFKKIFGNGVLLNSFTQFSISYHTLIQRIIFS